MTAVQVLGIPVRRALLEQWRAWLAPPRQPFFVDRATVRTSRAFPRDLTPELRDTYKVWRLDRRGLGVRWLDEAAFLARPRSERAELVRTQAAVGRGAVPTVRTWAEVIDPAILREHGDGRRFVWWPSLVDAAVAAKVVDDNESPCQRAAVAERTWRGCAPVLPNLRALAGTFPAGSGPNCFGAVLAAAGDSAADVRVLRRPFERWLARRTMPTGERRHDDDPGTVLLWRNAAGEAEHALVTIGDGWAFEKPSQEWCTARVVGPVGDLVKRNRTRGWRLSRHRITLSS